MAGSEKEKMNMLSLPDVCEQLSISVATGRNWIKRGVLIPDARGKREAPFFAVHTVERLIAEIASGENASLKKRRNKRYVSGSDRYQHYLPEDSENVAALEELMERLTQAGPEWAKIGTEDFRLRLILAEYALQLLRQALREVPCLGRSYNLRDASRLRESSELEEASCLRECFDPGGVSSLDASSCLEAFFEGDLSLGSYGVLIGDLVEDSPQVRTALKRFPSLFSVRLRWKRREDLLGFLYLSLKNLGERKAWGGYYTPPDIVDHMLADSGIGTMEETDGRILDPSCGTGSFILRLPESVRPEQIYGIDLDPVSVVLTRLNLAMCYPRAGIDWLKCQIRQGDFLRMREWAFPGSGEWPDSFRWIVGNPPWGARYSHEEKQYLAQNYSRAGKNPESSVLFLLESLDNLTPGGALAFVLPESLLHVHRHRPIREKIRVSCRISSLTYLGEVFHGVQCPAVTLCLDYTKKPMTTKGMRVKTRDGSFVIKEERDISPERFSFLMTDDEYRIAKKLRGMGNRCFLAGQADFALGIVTGDNRHFLKNAPEPGAERVLRGMDIRRYRLEEESVWLTFTPQLFQQVAPEAFYRAGEKLVYRFVSDHLIFACDSGQRLTLNSANVLIPRIPELPVKYVLAVLNSRMAQFLYEKDFHSVKILRSHIEQIPIPRGTQTEVKEVVQMVENLIQMVNLTERMCLYEQIDRRIASLYGLTEKEYAIILNAVGEDGRYL